VAAEPEGDPQGDAGQQQVAQAFGPRHGAAQEAAARGLVSHHSSGIMIEMPTPSPTQKRSRPIHQRAGGSSPTTRSAKRYTTLMRKVPTATRHHHANSVRRSLSRDAAASRRASSRPSRK
jgi:hypothetical protein